MKKLRNLTDVLRHAGLRAFLLLTMIVAMVGTSTASAQSLNWEGQTGVFVTPLAYAVPSTEKGFGMPVVAYHYLDAGGVLGGFHQVSVTVGALTRFEFGYTRNLHQDGSTPGLSNLWSSGFNTFHGKANVLREGRSWFPALSVGFVARSQIHNVGGVIQNKDTANADFYVVATKTAMGIRKLPLVLNLRLQSHKCLTARFGRECSRLPGSVVRCCRVRPSEVPGEARS